MEQSLLQKLILAARSYADRTDGRNVYELEGDLRRAAMGLKSAPISECDCGRTNEPWHPKRGKCKQSLGGMKL